MAGLVREAWLVSFFTIIVLNKGVPQAKFIAMVVVLTVFLSLIAHGISANPLAKLLGNNTDAKEDSLAE